MRRFALVALLIASSCIVVFAAKSNIRSSSNSKPVHVRTYTRKDSTEVHAHERLRGTASKASSVPKRVRALAKRRENAAGEGRRKRTGK
jgi:hypothetical protein